MISIYEQAQDCVFGRSLAKNATSFTSFGVTASSLVCRLVNKVEFDRSHRTLLSVLFQELNHCRSST